MRLKPNRWRVLIGTVLIALGLSAYWWSSRLQQYETLESPDHRFRLVVYRKPIWPSTMPGQGSDAPGVVRLYTSSGRLLNEAPVEMVQQVRDVEWTPDHVEVPLVFNFKLQD